jgi:sugar phosphate isomerase/epimerase
MPRPRIALELACLRLPTRKALHAAAELGAQAVEIDARGELSPQALSRTGLRQVRKMLEDLGLRVSAVSFRSRRGYASPEELDERVDATKAAMELAYQLGTSVLVGSIGRVPPPEEPDARRLLIDVLHDLGRYGQRAGAVLAAETGRESGSVLAALLAELPEGALNIDLNPGKLLVHGHSPLEAVRLLGRAIVHVHVSDALPGPAPDRDQYVAVGRGHADFPALLAALDEHNYRGYFTLQPLAAGDPLRQAAEAVAYLRGL